MYLVAVFDQSLCVVVKMLNVDTADIHLKLAQRHYKTRVDELRELIGAEEKKFKCVTKYYRRSLEQTAGLSREIVAEIDDIRSGVWDDKIIAKISPSPKTVPEDERVASPQAETETLDQTPPPPQRDGEILDSADHSTEVLDAQIETVVEPESNVKVG